MPNLNEYYHLLQTEKPPFDDDAMQSILRAAEERADKETLAVQAAESARHTRLNGASIAITTSVIVALTFWGYTYFQFQQPNISPSLPQTLQMYNDATPEDSTEHHTEYNTLRGFDEEYSPRQTVVSPQQAFIDHLQPEQLFRTEKEEEIPQLSVYSTDNTIKETELQNVSENKVMQNQPIEKPYWQHGRTIHQQHYTQLRQLTQRAFEQMDTKTTFTQLFAPCSLSSALAGQSTSDCILSLLESQSVQIQDSILQAFAVLAKKNSNFSSNNTPTRPNQPVKERVMNIGTSLTSPRTQSNALSSILNDGVNIPSNYERTMQVVVTEPNFPQKAQRSSNNNTASGYRQWLMAIQNRIWNITDKIEQSDSLIQPQTDPSLATEFQNQNLPLWFKETLQQKRYGYAKSIIDSMLARESKTAELYKLRGDVNKVMDSVEASITDYSRAISLQESSEIYRQRGTQYFTANKREEAYQDFDHAVRLAPKDAQAIFMRGAAAYNLKRFEEACDDWHLAAQMGHPFADSIIAEKCLGHVPKYARAAIADKKKHINDMMFLAERAKEGILRLPFGYSMAQQQYHFDFLSFKSLSPRCTIESALSGSATTYCVLHVFYTYLLEMPDDMLLFLAQQLTEQTQMAWSTAWTSPESVRSSSQQPQPIRDYVDKQIFDLVAKKNSFDATSQLTALQTTKAQINRSSVTQSANPSPEHNISIHKRLWKTVEDIQTYLRDNYIEFIEK